MELDITPLRCPQFYGVNVVRSLMHISASFLIHLKMKNVFLILVLRFADMISMIFVSLTKT